jgi:RHS repeat-associated protein
VEQAPTPSLHSASAGQPVTLYLGMVEVRSYGQGNAEEILLYPRPSIRISKTKDTGGVVVTRVSTLHRDALGSVRAVTTETGLKAERAVYRPFGEEGVATFSLTTAAESKGFIGERFDADAGLQYLNARYYDPKLGMFLQPDWWEVTEAGVGTNRYGYAGGDAVNMADPGGHAFGGGHERPDAPAGHTVGGTSFSEGRTADAGPRSTTFTGFDRFIGGLLGYNVDALRAYTEAGLTGSGDFLEFQKDWQAIESAQSRAISGEITNIEFVMGDLRFIWEYQGLAGFLVNNGFPDLRGIIVQGAAIEKMVGTHGWFSLSPAAKSKFFLHLSNPGAMNEFVNEMVAGSNVLPGGYSFAYNRGLQLGVIARFENPVGLTGFYKGNLPVSTNAARFDLIYAPDLGVASVVNGYPVP